jgi:hypothetical protein
VVVIRVRADELYQHPAEAVRDADDEPIFVAAKVENNPVVANKVDGRTELSFDIARAARSCLADNSKPDANRAFGPRMTLPELLQRSAGYHLHSSKISCRQIGDKQSRRLCERIPRVTARAGRRSN